MYFCKNCIYLIVIDFLKNDWPIAYYHFDLKGNGIGIGRYSLIIETNYRIIILQPES